MSPPPFTGRKLHLKATWIIVGVFFHGHFGGFCLRVALPFCVRGGIFMSPTADTLLSAISLSSNILRADGLAGGREENRFPWQLKELLSVTPGGVFIISVCFARIARTCCQVRGQWVAGAAPAWCRSLRFHPWFGGAAADNSTSAGGILLVCDTAITCFPSEDNMRVWRQR